MSILFRYLLFKFSSPVKVTKPLSIIFFCLVILIPKIGYSQEKNNYDETSLVLNVQHIGSLDIPAIISSKEEAYLSIIDIFNFLKIKNTPSDNFDSISGFFIIPKDKFLFDKGNNRIVYQGKIFNVPIDDMIRTETGLYLKTNYFGEVFGLECAFSFRNLSITLATKLELPAIREMQQEQMRKNISQLKGEKKADTTIKQQFSWLQLGVADWTLTTTEQRREKNYTRAGISLGAMIAGGEATANLNYISGEPFNSKNQYYNWRYVNNNRPSLRQISVGRLVIPSLSSVYAPLNGIQFTNTSTVYRRSFGTYRISNTTEPGWTVELYVNNVLVNYVKADPSGFYTFDVPLVYGNSAIMLRFYSPWGEERTEKQNITIPFNFLQPKQFEYNISGGIVEDDQKSRFTRAVFNYGLNKRVTVGGGAEYLSSVNSGKPMPFVNASLRLNSQVLVSGEYANDVRSMVTLNYHLPYNIQLDINYTKYARQQTAIKYNYLEQRKASLSVPLTGKKFSAFSRLTFNQFLLPKSKYTSAEFLLSGVILGVSSNLTTSALFSDPKYPSVFSNLSLTFRLPFALRFTTNIQYEYEQNKINSIKPEVEKRLGKTGFLNLSYEKNFISNTSFVNVGVRLNFSFAQTSFSASQGNHSASMSQSARGSFLFDQKTHLLSANDQSNIGKGGVIISPFLDLNNNGRRDTNEKIVTGLKFRINGGRIKHNEDGSLRVENLEAFNSYLIELDKNSFDKIAWQIKKPIIQVEIEPNHFKRLEIPVTVVGEASGMVYLKSNRSVTGISRILINIYDSNSVIVGRALSESDGYFSYFGLAPGSYTVKVDSAQLRKLKFNCSPRSLSVHIASSEDGVVADGFEFIVEPLFPDSQVIRNHQPSIQESTEKVAIQDKQSIGVMMDQPFPIQKEAPSARKNKKPAFDNKPDSLAHRTNAAIENKQSFDFNKGFNFNKSKPVNKVKTPSVKNPSLSRVNKNPVIHQTSKPTIYTPLIPKQKQEGKSSSLTPKQVHIHEEYRLVDQHLQKASQKVQKLIEEQKLLIRQNEELVKEIEELRVKLEEMNLKNRQSFHEKNHDHNLFKPWRYNKESNGYHLW